MNTDGTGFSTCKECHKTESFWNQTTTDHKEGEQLEDRRNVGESSCNFGDGTDHRVQSLMFMMMMMMITWCVDASIIYLLAKFYMHTSIGLLLCLPETHRGWLRTGAKVTVYSGDAGIWFDLRVWRCWRWFGWGLLLGCYFATLEAPGGTLITSGIDYHLTWCPIAEERWCPLARVDTEDKKKKGLYVVTLLFVVRVEWRAKFIKIVDTHVGGPEGQ